MSTLANFSFGITVPAGVLPEPAEFTHSPAAALARVARYFEALALGCEPGSPGENKLSVQKGLTAAPMAAATGTLTMATSSGAVGGTIAGTLVTVTWAVSDAHSCALLANAINAHATVGKYVKATALGSVVTLTSLDPGLSSNLVTLVASGANVTASGGTLTGGVGCDSEPTTLASATATIASGSGTVGVRINNVLVSVTWATSDTASALALAQAINANASVGVTAQSAAGVITLRNRASGKVGNDTLIAASGTGVSVSADRLSGGLGLTTADTFIR